MARRLVAATRSRRLTDPAERRKRFGVLMLALVTVFGLVGITGPGPWQQAISSALLAVTLVLSLAVAEVRPRFLRPIAGVCGLLTLATIIDAAAGHGAGRAAIASNLLFVTIAPPAVAIGTLRVLRQRNEVTIEAVFGVLCLYLLLGMFFAFLYALIARINGGAFFETGAAASAARCLYFSFTTLTTVGYGDLTASTNLGHTLSVAEALVGQIYLVTIVSLIVSNLGRRRNSA
ncbi:MAG TPA: potassium channel family protein [Solirubrobacteraceae bacterium]|nr:potassium channel family protein [Solirubrobacteraceae bacterium]